MNFKFPISLRRRKFCFLVVLVVFEIGSIGSISISSAYAEKIDLSLSPSITEIVGAPGTILTAPITITNHRKTKQKVTFSFVPFRSIGDDGSIAVENEATISAMFSLIEDGDSLPNVFELRPGETAKLTLTAAILQDAKPQDYYETLLFQTENEKTPTQTSSKVAVAIGTNILLSVYENGASPHPQARIEDFSTRRIFSTEDVVFTTRVENLGDHFFKAGGEIRILDVSGHEVYRSKLEEANVLTKAGRVLAEKEPPISSKRLFGKYIALATVHIGKETLTDSFTFYVVPKDKALLLTLGLIGLLLISFRLHLYSKIRRRAR